MLITRTPRRSTHAPTAFGALTAFGARAVLAALAVGTLTAATAVAQQQDLTLADATARALARNHDLAIEREAIVSADANIERARAGYDPVFRAELRYRDQTIPNNSLLSGAPPGELMPTVRGVISSASLTKFFSSGATITVCSSLARDTSNNFITLLSPAWTSALGIEARQPLLQGRANDNVRRGIRVARLSRDRSDIAVRRAVLETVNAVEQAYWTLVAARRDVDVRQRNLALAERQREDVASRIEGKVTPESDIAQPTAEIARRRGDLYAAEETRLRAERALKQLMLDSPTDPLWDAELRPLDAPDALAAPVDVQAALRDAEANRPELADVKVRLAIQDVEIDAARDRLKPQLDIVGSYTTRGLAGDLNPDAQPFGGINLVVPPELSGGIGQSIESVFRHRFPDASIGLQLTVPVGQRAARADVATAESVKRQAALLQEREAQRIAVEVRNGATALTTAAQRLEAARAGLDAAQVQLQAEQDRFAAGLTTTFFVLTRQNDLAAAELAETAALTSYRRALAEFLRAKGTLLRDRQIVLDAPPASPSSASARPAPALSTAAFSSSAARVDR